MCGNFILPRGEKSLWIFYSSVQLDFTINLAKSKALYDRFAEHKDEIERIVGDVLDWRRMNDKITCRILLEKQVDLKDDGARTAQFEWFMEKALAFKKAFSKYL